MSSSASRKDKWRDAFKEPPKRTGDPKISPKMVVPPKNAALAGASGNAGLRASSARPELSGGSEYLSVPEGLVVKGKTRLIKGPDASAAVQYPNNIALLALISQYGADISDPLTLVAKALVTFTGLIPRDQISLVATKDLRDRARDPDALEGARMLGLSVGTIEEAEESAARLALVLTNLFALQHGKANPGRVAETLSFIREELGFSTLSLYHQSLQSLPGHCRW